MKHTKKLFAIALTLIMALALSVPAFAADITVNNPDADETYKAYKIFNYTNAGTNYAYYIDTDDMVCANLNTLIDAYAQNGTDVFTLTPSKSDATHLNVVVNTGVTVDPVALAAYLSGYVSTMTATATADNGTFADLALGYYFVDTTLGSLCSLVNTDQTQVLYEKNPAPTVVKEVQEDSTGKWSDKNHADIDQTVNFKSTITIPANANNSSQLSGIENLVLHDEMAEVLVWDETTVAITVDGTTLADTNYTVNKNVLHENDADTEEDDTTCTFEIVFDQEYLDTLSNASHTIVVTYSAVVSSAAAADTAYVNTTWVTFGEKSESATDSTSTYTYDFNLFKYTLDADGTTEIKLDGAEFTLSKNADGTEPIAFVAVTDGYRVATDAEIEADEQAAEDAAEAGEEYVSTITTTLVAGEINILGLDEDTYYLTETVAPDGYNMLTAAVKVDIVANDSYADHTVEKDDAVAANDQVKVLNQTGALLPSTGGIGTTIFYVVGALLMAGAGVLLVTKKRMADEE